MVEYVMVSDYGVCFFGLKSDVHFKRGIRIRVELVNTAALRDRCIHPSSTAVHRLFEWMTSSRNPPLVVLVNC